MSDMNIRALLGRGRELLGQFIARESAPRGPGTFSLLALRLERDLPRKGKGRSVLVAATDDDAVGVEAILELAWCLAAELGHSVLVVDGAFDVRPLSAALGMEDKPGLAEMLDAPSRDHEMLRALAQPTQHERISVLPQGSGLGDRVTRAEVLRHLLATASDHFDYVLVHGSILVEDSRSLSFSSLIDAALLVAVEEQTTVDHIARSQRLLNDCGAARVALVLVNSPAERRPNGR
jgi:septum formation inhibitor-activating ATPase MinD